MLNNLSKQIRECLDHAEDCARKAAAQTDPKLKVDFLNMERRWLALAQSYEFTQRLGDFSDEAKQQADKKTETKEKIKALLLCPKCNKEMGLFGVEAESDVRDLYTFECSACRALEVRGVQRK